MTSKGIILDWDPTRQDDAVKNPCRELPDCETNALPSQPFEAPHLNYNTTEGRLEQIRTVSMRPQTHKPAAMWFESSLNVAADMNAGHATRGDTTGPGLNNFFSSPLIFTVFFVSGLSRSCLYLLLYFSLSRSHVVNVVYFSTSFWT